jgi:hypothetical protein
MKFIHFICEKEEVLYQKIIPISEIAEIICKRNVSQFPMAIDYCIFILKSEEEIHCVLDLEDDHKLFSFFRNDNASARHIISNAVWGIYRLGNDTRELNDYGTSFNCPTIEHLMLDRLHVANNNDR